MRVLSMCSAACISCQSRKCRTPCLLTWACRLQSSIQWSLRMPDGFTCRGWKASAVEQVQSLLKLNKAVLCVS